MGYSTKYTLMLDITEVLSERYEKKQHDIEEIQLSNISNELKLRLIKEVEASYRASFPTRRDVVDFLGFNPFEDSCTWYAHEVDMKAFSMKHEDVIFILYGDGEENGDMWTKYFLNGKMQEERAVISYGEFDKQKLK